MRHFLVAAVLIFAAFAAQAAEQGPRLMTGWFHVTTPDGWTGKRYVDGDVVFAEEFDSNADNRIDVWRFYRRGMLSTEERDLTGDGKVNYQARWEPRDLRLVRVLRDTRGNGINDLEIEASGNRRWIVREDRNGDGIADRILIVNGPPDLFERLGMDLAKQAEVIDSIPAEYWYELQTDTGFTGTITDYRRYSRGRQSHFGEWENNRVVWRRAPADGSPPPSAAATPPLVAAGPTQPTPPSDGWQQAPDVAQGQAQPQAGDPFSDPFGDPFATQTPVYAEPQFTGPAPSPTDRTRYEGLPPGDSAARSLPARMRPPGEGRR